MLKNKSMGKWQKYCLAFGIVMWIALLIHNDFHGGDLKPIAGSFILILAIVVMLLPLARIGAWIEKVFFRKK